MRKRLYDYLGERLYRELRFFVKRRILHDDRNIPPEKCLLNIIEEDLLTCNFCGTVFYKVGRNHSEFLACPSCGAIARERVVYQSILHELSNRSGTSNLFISGNKNLKTYRLLEMSPRVHEYRVKLWKRTLKEYRTSDYNMAVHTADVKLDLTREEDIAPFENAFDIIISSHVLEHIPDYRLALKNLKRMLTERGFLVLQVPILEANYTLVTWDEFHHDDSRVYHRFGFDLSNELKQVFSRVVPVVGLIDFDITCDEISPDKYIFLKNNPSRLITLGEELVNRFGLGCPDLCDAFIIYR